MRTGKTERKIDALEAATEKEIDALYSSALASAFRKCRDPLTRIRVIMDGKEKPPRRCVTDRQIARWREKTLKRLLLESRLAESMAESIISAGKTSVSVIKQNGLEVYRTAYSGTLEKLKG